MQRRNPERRAQQEMRRIAQAEGAGGRYASGPGAGFGGVVGAIVAGEWTSFGRVGITPLSAFYIAPGTSSAEPPGRIGFTPLSAFRIG
jgi:hypothetical protein